MRKQPPQPNSSNSGSCNGRVSPSSEPAGSSLNKSDSCERADLKFKIAEDTYAIVNFEGVMTQEALAKLIAHLQLHQDVFPTKEMLNRVSSPAVNVEQQPVEQQQKSLFENVVDEW